MIQQTAGRLCSVDVVSLDPEKSYFLKIQTLLEIRQNACKTFPIFGQPLFVIIHSFSNKFSGFSCFFGVF